MIVMVVRRGYYLSLCTSSGYGGDQETSGVIQNARNLYEVVVWHFAAAPVAMYDALEKFSPTLLAFLGRKPCLPCYECTHLESMFLHKSKMNKTSVKSNVLHRL